MCRGLGRPARANQPDAGAIAPRLHEAEAEPERGPGGAFTVFAIEEGLVRTGGERLAFVIVPGQIRGDREPLEVFRVGRRLPVGGPQQPIRFGPLPPLERLPAALQCGEVRHAAGDPERPKADCDWNVSARQAAWMSHSTERTLAHDSAGLGRGGAR